jgi:hypothetical protein
VKVINVGECGDVAKKIELRKFGLTVKHEYNRCREPNSEEAHDGRQSPSAGAVGC